MCLIFSFSWEIYHDIPLFFYLLLFPCIFCELNILDHIKGSCIARIRASGKKMDKKKAIFIALVITVIVLVVPLTFIISRGTSSNARFDLEYRIDRSYRLADRYLCHLSIGCS